VSKTALTFYGGIGCIGGNKILLRDRDAKIFLDFGEPFNFGEKYFSRWLWPRESRFGLKDYFVLNLIEPLMGLYSEKMLEHVDLPYTEPEYQGIFISHIHSDHNRHLRFVDEKIPVYFGQTTLRMLESWQLTSRFSVGEHEFRTFRTGDRIKIDDLEIEPIHVDHSTPAAYGFLIHSSEGAIAYTGDLRRHGPMSHLTEDFINAVKEARPSVLICEGTRVAPKERRQNLTEKQVYQTCVDIVSRTKNLVVTTFYGRDVDRMKTFYKIAKKTNRRFIVSSRIAHLLNALLPDPGIEVPDPIRDESIGIYCRVLKRRYVWEKELLEHAIDAQYIRENQKNIILVLDFSQFAELIDIMPAEGSSFIHSMSEPFEEDDIEDEIKHNWCERFNLEFHQAHASGHCSKDEIFKLIKEINPKKVIPIHTEHPRLFKVKFDNALIPASRQQILL